MPSIHRVITYSGLNYHQALDLPVDAFMLMVKNSLIDECQRTEEGRKYLEDCKRLNQTDIDVSAFRKKARKQRGGN